MDSIEKTEILILIQRLWLRSNKSINELLKDLLELGCSSDQEFRQVLERLIASHSAPQQERQLMDKQQLETKLEEHIQHSQMLQQAFGQFRSNTELSTEQQQQIQQFEQTCQQEQSELESWKQQLQDIS